MKTRRLSEIDLAVFVSLTPGHQLEQALRGYNAGGGSWSYDPIRASTPDILEASMPLFGAAMRLDWAKIEEQIARACKRGEEQRSSNVGVGRVLFSAARELKWAAAKFSMGRLPIGFGESVRYWSDIVLADQHGQFIPFFDHRRAHGVADRSARRVIYSMQNIWVRERNPDLASARLAVVRFPCEQDRRFVQVLFHEEGDLLSYEELNSRVSTVYETWARICREKAEPRRGTGTDGQSSWEF